MLQDFVESLPPLDCPVDLERFSPSKKLFDYQREALRNAHRLLHYYYAEIKEDKESLWREYVKRGFRKEWEGNSEILKKHFKEVSYKTFVNRASFWMATGSGKTLLIVKLIELLDHMMGEGLIPKRDVLFLTQRDDLVEAFKKHVEEYNRGRSRKIVLEELRNFHERKANPAPSDGENLLVFYYRADLLSDRKGEKVLHYENYHNEGKWYLLLDEAHKGDAEESKRRQIFTVLTKRGFLFNFSATFTEEFDKASTLFRFNLADFVREGYGKHLAVMETQTSPFKRKGADYSEEEKRKIVLKLLTLTGFLRKIRDERYPSPLAVVLVNTVNTKDADLKLFFEELFKVAEGSVREETFLRVREELLKELKEVEFWAEGGKLREEEVEKLCHFTLEDLYRYFFSSYGPSEVEIVYHPENKKELAFQLKNADEPFAVVRIGSVVDWLKTLSEKVVVRELLEKEEFFLKIDERESVSLLAGSRSFYEGWDSPRPNVIAYVNVGGREARKFVLQSLGRGVRIKVKEGGKEYRKRRDAVRALETLYVFATSRKSLLSVVGETLRREEEWEVLKGVEKNPKVEEKELLVPLYEKSKEKVKNRLKFYAGSEDYAQLKALLSNLDSPALLSLLTGKTPEVCRELITSFDEAVKIRGEKTFNGPLAFLKALAEHFTLHLEEVSGFEEVGDRINHFKRIEVNVRELGREKKQLLENYLKSGREVRNLEGLAVERFEEHFYLPLLRGVRPGAPEWVRRVAKGEGQLKLLEDLKRNESLLREAFDWWAFSRLEKKTDFLYVPYYKNGRELKWRPDFVFWLAKGEDYWVVLLEAEGVAGGERFEVLEGAKRLFEGEEGLPKVFVVNGKKVRVLFFFYGKPPEGVPQAYKPYWVERVGELVGKVLEKAENGQ